MPLENEDLGRLLEVADHVRIVIFNSCDSASQAELAARHADLGIGMDSSIGDETAKTFAAQF